MKDMLKKPFPWGTVTKEHVIGPHTIVEYVVSQQWENAGETQFHTSLVGSSSWPTLEWAMLALVCQSASPNDYHLPEYAARLIGLELKC